MSCWKCGAECGGIECERCGLGDGHLAGPGPEIHAVEIPASNLQAFQAFLEEMRRRAREEWMLNSAELDWGLINGPDDLRIFMFAIYQRTFPVNELNAPFVKEFMMMFFPPGCRMNKKHQSWQTLKKYCKAG